MTALIRIGSLGDFSVLSAKAAGELEEAEQLSNFSTLSQVSESVSPDSFDYFVSNDRRGLALSRITLGQEFQNVIARVLDLSSDIYFLAWAWDVKGLSQYPGLGAAADSCLIPLRGGEFREFIGTGALLFPPRRISAGLALRIQIWESRQATRNFGALINQVATTIQDSDLNSILLSLAGPATPMTGGAAGAYAAIGPAAAKLTQIIGNMLMSVGDTAVDYFEGYFPAAGKWDAGEEEHTGAGSTITLARMT